MIISYLSVKGSDKRKAKQIAINNLKRSRATATAPYLAYKFSLHQISQLVNLHPYISFSNQ